MRKNGYIIIGLVIIMTMIPGVTSLLIWSGDVLSNGAVCTTAALPSGSVCTITAGRTDDPSMWWYSQHPSLRADVQYYETVANQAEPWSLHSPSFLQFGTITPMDQDWGPYMKSHIYTKGGVIGQGLPLKFQIVDLMDSNYGNNRCHIPVSIDCACTEKCDTAWANWGDDGICLIPCSKKWGWYTTASLDELKGGITSDVWAGAGQCNLNKGQKVGTVKVQLDMEADLIAIDFSLNGDCRLPVGWQVWVSDNTLCPVKGFNTWYKGEGESDTIVLPAALTDTNGDGAVFVAVHSSVCCSDGCAV